jgi:hypothetical protein
LHQIDGKPDDAPAGTLAGMDATAATWRLTLDLLEAAHRELDAGADPAMLTLAHVGAAVMLFADCDLATAERLAAAITNQAAS